MKSVLFCRVSSKDQEDGGYSLPAQEKLLAGYAEGYKMPLSVAKTFRISESASGNKQRQIFSEMLLYMRKNKINILLVEKVDRLTRSLKSAVEINEWINEDALRQVHFVKENVILNKDSRSNEKFIWNIKVSVAQYYTDNLSEEVRKGQGEKLAQGWFPGQARFGYRTVGEKKHKTHVVNEVEAIWIKRMFDLFETGEYSLKRLEKKLEDEGLRTRAGGRVGKTNISRYLVDVIYTGRMRWCGSVYPGKHEPIVSSSQFDRVQKLLKRKDAPKYSKHDHLLRGLVNCASCGKGITWEVQKGDTYGYCRHPKECQERTGAKASDAEASLLPSLDELVVKNARVAEILRQGLKERHREQGKESESLLSELRKRHDQAATRLSNLFDEKMDGNVAKETYDEKFKQYSEEKERFAKAMLEHSDATTYDLEVKTAVFDLSQEGRSAYLRSNNEKRRSLIGIVFEPLTMQAGSVKFEMREEFALLAKVANGVNCSNSGKTEEIEETIFELEKSGFQSRKDGSFETVRPAWRRGRDSNPGIL